MHVWPDGHDSAYWNRAVEQLRRLLRTSARDLQLGGPHVQRRGRHRRHRPRSIAGVLPQPGDVPRSRHKRASGACNLQQAPCSRQQSGAGVNAGPQGADERHRPPNRALLLLPTGHARRDSAGALRGIRSRRDRRCGDASMGVSPRSRPLRRRPTVTPAAVGASRDGVGLLTPARLLRQQRGRQARADLVFRAAESRNTGAASIFPLVLLAVAESVRDGDVRLRGGRHSCASRTTGGCSPEREKSLLGGFLMDAGPGT